MLFYGSMCMRVSDTSRFSQILDDCEFFIVWLKEILIKV